MTKIMKKRILIRHLAERLDWAIRRGKPILNKEAKPKKGVFFSDWNWIWSMRCAEQVSRLS